MNKLWVRLSLGFSGVMLIAVLLVALAGIFVGRQDDSANNRPNIVRDLTTLLVNYYEREGSWEDVGFLLRTQPIFGGRGRFRGPDFFLADKNKRIVYHPHDRQIGKNLESNNYNEIFPIDVRNETVGYLAIAPDRPDDSLGFSQFLGRVLLITAALAGVSGIISGILMSRSLTAPLDHLAQAARAIGTRDLSRRVDVRGSQELQAVAVAFNEMADDLDQAEQLRRGMLADVAHELRTPLTVLQGNMRAMLDGVYPMDTTEMARLYEQTRLLSRLVNDLHELAQAEAKKLPLHIQAVDLATLIQTTSDTFSPLAEEKGVNLHTQLPADLPLIPLDSARIKQVLHNLINNSLRHTPDDGSVTIAVEPDVDTVLIKVIDTGEGIPPEHLPQIFDRFYRTDLARTRDRGGAGLGLAIARAIVEVHGGQMSVVSEGIPGKGSTFMMRLPLAGEPVV
ncbi:MAG: ATP-binding protein [Chloroflexota bacterium]